MLRLGRWITRLHDPVISGCYHGLRSVRVEHGGKHPRRVFRHADREMFYVLPGTPSNVWTGERNMLAELRRMTGGSNSEKQSS